MASGPVGELRDALDWLGRVADHPNPTASRFASRLLSELQPVIDERDEDWVDSAVNRDDYRSAAVLSLTTTDIANVKTVTGSMKSVRNHGVAIRRLLSREAKRIRAEEAKAKPPEPIEGQTTIEDFT